MHPQVTPIEGFTPLQALLANGQETHAAACHGFAVGCFVFFGFAEKTKHPTRMGSVREPGSLTHLQVTPAEGVPPASHVETFLETALQSGCEIR